jgi:hypothetical protein
MYCDVIGDDEYDYRVVDIALEYEGEWKEGKRHG